LDLKVNLIVVELMKCDEKNDLDLPFYKDFMHEIKLIRSEQNICVYLMKTNTNLPDFESRIRDRFHSFNFNRYAEISFDCYMDLSTQMVGYIENYLIKDPLYSLLLHNCNDFSKAILLHLAKLNNDPIVKSICPKYQIRTSTIWSSSFFTL